MSRPHIVVRELYNPPEPRIYPGGGGSGYPRTNIARHANKIFREAEQLKQVVTEVARSVGVNRVHYKVELPDEINVWTSTGVKLEDSIHASIVGSPKSNIAHVSSTPQSFDLLVEELQRYSNTGNHVGKSKFSIVESVSRIPFEEKASSSLMEMLENADEADVLLALFPDLLREDKAAYVTAITAHLRNNHGQLISASESDVGLLLKVRGTPQAIRSVAEDHMGIYSADPLNQTIILSALQGPIIDDVVEVLPNVSEARACIIDSGVVANSRFLETSILDREDPLGPPHSPGHGTFVAGRIIYGDSISEQIANGRMNPDVKLLSVNIFTRDEHGREKPPTEDEMVTAIRDTVERWHRQIKVFNLSVNLTSVDENGKWIPIDDQHVGVLAAEIDHLSKKFGVLFILSSGNLRQHNITPEGYPNHFTKTECRLLPPGESMLALTVGAIAAKHTDGCLAAQNEPSAFTRRGPGFQSYRKPDLVANGGNSTASGIILPEVAAVGISPDGSCLSYGTGTSFSTPLITRLASHIFNAIPGCTANLVRAVLIHFSEQIFSENFNDDDLLQLVGNGIPHTERLLRSDQWRQSFFFQGNINWREIQRVPFLVPEQLLNRQIRDKVQISFTVAFSPETARTLKSGYCKSHISAKLMRIDARSGQLKDVASEDDNTRINDRYATIVRGNKRFSRNIVSGEWCLRLEHLSRWTLSDPLLPYAAIITVTDPHRDPGIDIHAAIRQMANTRYENELTVPAGRIRI